MWITPLRALAKDIGRAMEEVIEELGMQWKVAIRNGDTSTTERAKQKYKCRKYLLLLPKVCIYYWLKKLSFHFSSLKIIAVDEWHELLGSKRGVQVELAISRIVGSQESGVRSWEKSVLVWGISATIGNLEEAKEVLLAPIFQKGVIVKADLKKRLKLNLFSR